MLQSWINVLKQTSWISKTQNFMLQNSWIIAQTFAQIVKFEFKSKELLKRPLCLQVKTFDAERKKLNHTIADLRSQISALGEPEFYT